MNYLAHGFAVDVALHVVHRQRIELRQRFLHQHPGLHQTLFHALAHVRDRLVHPDLEPVDAAQPVLVVLDRVERGHAAGAAHLHEEVKRLDSEITDLQGAGAELEEKGADIATEIEQGQQENADLKEQRTDPAMLQAGDILLSTDGDETIGGLGYDAAELRRQIEQTAVDTRVRQLYPWSVAIRAHERWRFRDHLTSAYVLAAQQRGRLAGLAAVLKVLSSRIGGGFGRLVR